MAEGIFYTLGLRTSAFTGPLDTARGLVGRFQSSMAGMAARAAALAAPVVGVGAAFVGLKKAITAAADMETTVARFESLTGSAQKAHAVLSDLKKLGAETPFEFPELADAASKLIAFGEAADQTPETLRKIGDIASGVQAPIGDIAEIYGKARVAGTLFAEDINQLTGRGIPVIQQFARMLGVSEGEIKKLGSEGKLTFPMLEQAFTNLTMSGGQFYGMMSRQSTTTNGLISTLKDNLGELFRIIGEPINDFLRPMLAGAIERVGRLGAGMSAFLQLLQAAKQQGKFGEFLGDSLLLGVLKSVNAFSSGIRGSVAYLATTLPAIFTAARESLLGQRFALIVQSAFGAAAATMAAVLSKGAADIAEVLGRKAMSDDLRGFAKDDEQRAKNYLQILKSGLSGMSGEEFADLGRRIADAHSAGAAAFGREMEGGDLIDTSLIEGRLGALGKALNPDAMKAFMDAWNGNTKALEAAPSAIAKTVGNFTAALDPAKVKGRRGTASPEDVGELDRRRRRGLLNAEESWAARMARRSKRDRELDPSGLGRGVFGPAIPQAQPGFDRRQLGRINDRALDAMGRARGGNPRPIRPPRELVDGQSRSEQLLMKIEGHLSKAIPG